jgi:hypothetical protein
MKATGDRAGERIHPLGPDGVKGDSAGLSLFGFESYRSAEALRHPTRRRANERAHAESHKETKAKSEKKVKP